MTATLPTSWPGDRRRPRGDDELQGAALDTLRLRAAAGLPPDDGHRLAPRARRAVAVAQAIGAPLLPALDAAAAAEGDVRATQRAVAVASAQAKAVAAGLLGAPFVLLPFLGTVFGADLLDFYTTVAGRIVAAVGLLLLVLGGGTVLLLIRRVGAPSDPRRSAVRTRVSALAACLVVAGLVHPVAGAVVGALVWRRGAGSPSAPAGVDETADLTAVGLAGGVGPGEALRAAARELPQHAAELRGRALELELGLHPDPNGALQRLSAVLRAATDIGAPAAPALRRLAGELRADERARVLAAAERLPAQLTFPTALALLPATLLLVGAPIVQVGLQQAMP